MPSRKVLLVRSFFFGAALVAIAMLAGCGSKDALKTNKVRGKVVFEKGGSVKNLHEVEAAVQFESIDQPGVLGSAEIQEDGTLSNFITRKEEVAENGLVEGSHRVRLRLDPSRASLVHPQFLKFEQSGITVKVPSDEEMIIRVWR